MRQSCALLFHVTLVITISMVWGQFTWLRTFDNDTMIRVPILSWSQKYEPTVKSLRNFTLDEKCERGLGLGIGYQVYDPYVKVGV